MMRKDLHRSKAAKNAFSLFLFVLLLLASRSFAQTAATNLVVDSTAGDVDRNEVDTFISFMTNAGGVNANAVLPNNALGDNLAYGTPGLNLEAINDMYRITGDMMINNPSMSVEQMQLMNLAILWSERFIQLRNDQPLGNHLVMWTGNVDPVWQTYATGTANAGYAGSENGDTAGHILYTALNILQTPSIWNNTVPDGNPNGFGVTYLQRAQTYIAMMEVTTQSYFTKYFINPTTYQIVPPTSPAWTVFNENMDAWNRQFLLTNGYLRLAQCHAILNDNPTLQTLYTNIVKTSTNAYIANAIPVTATQTVSSLFPSAEAVYDSGYGNMGDVSGQVTGNSSSHTSYEFQGLARTYEAGPQYSSATLMNMERYANTIEYAMFNYPGYAPPPYTLAPFNVKLSSPYVTAYYKTIDAGLTLPTSNSSSDYLYGQFYFMTPYNTLFWQPAANGAAPNNHNNYHNNPYFTTGILYSKHWVYMHPQTMISVASNTATVTAGGTATYSIATNSSTPVTLSIPDLPAGATATFSPAVVPAGSGSSTLSVHTSSDSVNGSALFTLVGSSNGAVQTMGVSLVITAPDFAISASGTSTVAAGSNGSFTITVKPLNGFTGDVTLSADPQFALAGTAISFSPAVITGGTGTSTVTVTTSNTTPTPGGAWSQGFIGTSGSTTHEAYTRLTVKNVPQTITLPVIGTQVYGVAPIQLPLATSQNQMISYAVTGPASLTGGPTLQGYSLTVNGVGTVSVTATQAGTSYYAAATPAVESFTVNPAVLAVAAQNKTMVYNSALPVLTSTITGFVNSDTSSVVTGAPSLSTTATSSSAVGTYPITVAAGTLTAANYTFAFTSGTLTVTPAQGTITLGNLAQIYTGAPIAATATTTPAGLPVSFTYNASPTAPTVAGTYAVVATINNPNYSGTASGTLVISKATPAVVLSVSPTGTTAGQNVSLTAFVSSEAATTPTGTVTFKNGTTTLGTAQVSAAGVAAYTSNAFSGVYSVSAAYGGDLNFAASVAPLPAPLTVSDYSLSASTPVFTVSQGQTGSTTITITPVANYTGAIVFACGQLPAGANCAFSANSVNLDGSGTAATVTLTVSARSNASALAPTPTHPRQKMLVATACSPPVMLGGSLLIFAGKARSVRKKIGALILAIVCVGLLGLSGCSNSSVSGFHPGAISTVTVTGAGAAPLSHTVNLTVTIQ
ncbi:MAG: MBG domain-containing protein [Terracidiphilus sp.]|nr:MBG domain-containing protein [Terracidiphilus sp.]